MNKDSISGVMSSLKPEISETDNEKEFVQEIQLLSFGKVIVIPCILNVKKENIYIRWQQLKILLACKVELFPPKILLYVAEATVGTFQKCFLPPPSETD